MNTRATIFLNLMLASSATVALAPGRGETIEEVCKLPAAHAQDARVRVAWKDLDTDYDDVRITYCVLRGDRDAKLTFERDAEIVYFALATLERKPDRRKYTFRIRTSAGRVITQGPAVLQPLSKEPQSCRVDVCQFFTEPGERVVSVAVETGR